MLPKVTVLNCNIIFDLKIKNEMMNIKHVLSNYTAHLFVTLYHLQLIATTFRSNAPH